MGAGGWHGDWSIPGGGLLQGAVGWQFEFGHALIRLAGRCKFSARLFESRVVWGNLVVKLFISLLFEVVEDTQMLK